MKEIIDQYSPILEGIETEDLKAKVKKKQKQIRLTAGPKLPNKDKQSKPLPSLNKINDPDSTSNSSS